VSDASSNQTQPIPHAGLLARCALGGVLMGIANLVPGISGGTMLVATGIYTRFIDAVSDITRFRWKLPTLIVLGVIAAAALVAIGGLAGAISYGLGHARWAMYSAFIGLTLGGAPLLWRMVRPMGAGGLAGLIVGGVVMLALVLLQTREGGGGPGTGGTAMLVIGGAAGASAMILPGVSGAYLLLLLGLYEPIIESIKRLVEAAKSASASGVTAELGVVVPVGVGVVIGVVAVSNILRVVLHRYEKVTLGVLLGLLLAAPAGLYPFREGVAPKPGDVVAGVIVNDENIDEIDPKHWAERVYTPSAGRAAASLALIAGGFGVTLLIDRLGREKSA